MQVPKWFWAVLAVCVVALTGTIVWRQRYVVHEAAIMDLWRGRYCYPDSCETIGERSKQMDSLDSLIAKAESCTNHFGRFAGLVPGCPQTRATDNLRPDPKPNPFADLAPKHTNPNFALDSLRAMAGQRVAR